MNFTSIKDRIYSDYFMKSRLDEYEKLIIKIKSLGYQQMGLRQSADAFKNGVSSGIFVHRHDIDTDIETARKIFEIERSYDVRSTFYFRLSTLDFELMREIEEFGGEASYHYEELAAHAKRYNIKSPEGLKAHIPRIQGEFLQNLNRIRERSGLHCSTVASHGDFINRALGLDNKIILSDQRFRSQCDIDLEAYDVPYMTHFTYRCSDTSYPAFWTPYSPYEILENYNSNIFLLTHPAHWRSNALCNVRENLKRIFEGIRWSI